MTIFNLFSKRQKVIRGELPEVYLYDNIPKPLRVQIVIIITDAFGTAISTAHHNQDKPGEAYRYIHEVLNREYGVFTLAKGYRESDQEAVLNQLLNENNVERVLDVTELCFSYLSLVIKADHYYTSNVKVKIKPNEAIEELNDRFKEHGIGYRFESNQILRIDSTYIHSEVTKPTLSLLWNEKFIGANDEYLKAHEHYRNGRNKECLNECLKAFESTLKIICTEKGWQFNQTDTANKLIKVCFDNNLVPSYTQNQFSSLQNLLTTGIPTIRNKVGGHGQGQIPQKVDDEMTRYGLNLTGTNIIFLIEQSGIY